MEAAWNILQLRDSDDFIIATGETHTVQEFVEESFRIVSLDPEKYVVSDKKFFRPTSNTILAGNTAKANKAFGFDPKIKFKELVKLMVETDLKHLKGEP